MPRRKQDPRWQEIATLQMGGFEEIARIVERGPHAFQMQEIGKVLSTFLGRDVGWKPTASPFA